MNEENDIKRDETVKAIDFKILADIIFKNKNKYSLVSDEEKASNFFILNRKFAIKFIKQAEFFNTKNVDRASAMDIWFSKFYNNSNGVPDWYWRSKSGVKEEKSKFTKAELSLLKESEQIKDIDIKFLVKYFEDDLRAELKKLKKRKK